MTDAKPTKLDKLLTKQRQLAEQIAAINAREKAGERKAETRRKILIGGAVLASYRHGDYPQERLASLLDSYLTHDRDRDLFDFLPPRLEDAKAEPATAPVVPAAPAPPAAASVATATSRPDKFYHNPSPRKEDYL